MWEVDETQRERKKRCEKFNKRVFRGMDFFVSYSKWISDGVEGFSFFLFVLKYVCQDIRF